MNRRDLVTDMLSRRVCFEMQGAEDSMNRGFMVFQLKVEEKVECGGGKRSSGGTRLYAVEFDSVWSVSSAVLFSIASK
jgi:hypothetical protein